jgi:hypothetical protein
MAHAVSISDCRAEAGMLPRLLAHVHRAQAIRTGSVRIPGFHSDRIGVYSGSACSVCEALEDAAPRRGPRPRAPTTG